MPNPFNILGGNQNPMMGQFQQFMNQMRGRDPQQMINELVSSGKINQNQLNQIQRQAQQMQSMFDGIKNMFGF